MDTNLSSKIITGGGESWCHGSEQATKQQSSEWKLLGSSRPEKTLHVKCNVRTMLICFFTLEVSYTQNSTLQTRPTCSGKTAKKFSSEHSNL